MAQPRARPNIRPDHNGIQRAQFESNKKKIYATQSVCGICGKAVDFGFKFPHPLSPCIDHIIPVAKGGHPSDIGNLQLAHMTCNRQKSDKLKGTVARQSLSACFGSIFPTVSDDTIRRRCSVSDSIHSRTGKSHRTAEFAVSRIDKRQRKWYN